MRFTVVCISKNINKVFISIIISIIILICVDIISRRDEFQHEENINSETIIF